MEDITWIKISDQKPPEGEKVLTKIDDRQGVRNIISLTRRKNLYFSGEIYVYYTPTHWKRLRF